MALAHFIMLVHELLNEDPDMVPKEAPLIVLDSKSAMCMANNVKDTIYIRHIARRMHFLRNGEKCKMHKMDLCEGGLQFSSLTIIYFILGVRSGSLKLLVPIYANCRPPSHQSILCILNFYPFLTKFILLAMCLVCLLSLPFLSMHIADLLSKTIKGASFGTMYGFSFSNS